MQAMEPSTSAPVGHCSSRPAPDRAARRISVRRVSGRPAVSRQHVRRGRDVDADYDCDQLARGAETVGRSLRPSVPVSWLVMKTRMLAGLVVAAALTSAPSMAATEHAECSHLTMLKLPDVKV